MEYEWPWPSTCDSGQKNKKKQHTWLLQRWNKRIKANRNRRNKSDGNDDDKLRIQMDHYRQMDKKFAKTKILCCKWFDQKHNSKKENQRHNHRNTRIRKRREKTMDRKS